MPEDNIAVLFRKIDAHNERLGKVETASEIAEYRMSKYEEAQAVANKEAAERHGQLLSKIEGLTSAQDKQVGAKNFIEQWTPVIISGVLAVAAIAVSIIWGG